MNADICRADESREVFTAERCSILELANDASDPAVSIARARVAPGVATEWHWLEGIAERYVIVSGRGRVEVGDLAPASVGAADLGGDPAIAFYEKLGIREDVLHFDIPVGEKE